MLKWRPGALQRHFHKSLPSLLPLANLLESEAGEKNVGRLQSSRSRACGETSRATHNLQLSCSLTINHRIGSQGILGASSYRIRDYETLSSINHILATSWCLLAAWLFTTNCVQLSSLVTDTRFHLISSPFPHAPFLKLDLTFVMHSSLNNCD